jgi:hypothetical protein
MGDSLRSGGGEPVEVLAAAVEGRLHICANGDQLHELDYLGASYHGGSRHVGGWRANKGGDGDLVGGGDCSSDYQ